MMTDEPGEEVKGSEERPNKRPPPTIDLEASDVSGDTQAQASPDAAPAPPRASRFPLAAILPPLAGALAALVVMGILWAAGLIGSEPQQVAAVAPAVTSGLNDLSDRIGKVETKLSATPPADSALRARVDTLESAANTLRDQTAALRKQVDAATVTLNALKSAPRDGDAAPDLTALTERLARLEQAVRALPEKSQAAAGNDDIRPRRLVIATVLETKVRRGEPYAAALAAAKSVADDKTALAPLDAMADIGVPTDAALAKDLLALLPQLAPPPQASPQTSSAPQGEPIGKGLLGQLASKLVKVERVDASGDAPPDANAELQAIAAAARQNDVRKARAEIDKLPPDLKAKLQPWLDRAGARDTALNAAAAFTSSALTSMSKAG
jgi:hypothetical protein